MNNSFTKGSAMESDEIVPVMGPTMMQRMMETVAKRVHIFIEQLIIWRRRATNFKLISANIVRRGGRERMTNNKRRLRWGASPSRRGRRRCWAAIQCKSHRSIDSKSNFETSERKIESKKAAKKKRSSRKYVSRNGKKNTQMHNFYVFTI